MQKRVHHVLYKKLTEKFNLIMKYLIRYILRE
jgi:hypothetical protein